MKGYNFSKIIQWIEIILAMVVVLNLAVTFYAINQLTESSITSVSNRINTDVDNLSGALSGIHAMMLTEVGYDKDMDKLLVTDAYRAKINDLTIKSRIKSMISNWSRDLPFAVHYVIYFPGNNIIIDDCNTNEDYNLWRSVKKEMITSLDKLEFKSNWNIVRLDGKEYLLDIISNNGRYMFAYISLEDVMKSLETEFYGTKYYLAFSDHESGIYYHPKEIAKDEIKVAELTDGKVKRNRVKQILILRRDIDQNNSIILVIHQYNSMLKAFRFQILLVLFMIAVVISVLAILRLVNKTVLRPIQAFNENVETLKSNEVYDVATHYQITELGNASKLMSDMVGRIKGLKIDIYEKTLEQQKTKMDFLTLQIEPHFYLNCLNIIYNMAQMEQYKEIQHLSNCVSEYLRYIFKSHDSFSTVSEELEHIRKYLEIQKIRYGDCFESRIVMEDEILQAKLPPLVLQTFVENSVKYTINWEDDIELSLSGKRIEDKAVIVIEDTGDGYASDILYKLQNGIDISEGQNRIGIMNAVSRMRLAFGEEGSIRFYNRPTGGAGAEIRFPLR